MKARALIIFSQAALASAVDLDLYTDFTADYDFDGNDLLQLDPTMPKETEHGRIQLNIAKERFMVKADGQYTLTPADMAGVPPPLDQVPPGPWIGHGEMRFDGPAGFASMRGNYHYGGLALELCFKVNVPPNMVPPTSDLHTQEQAVAQQVRQLPHQDMEVGTESITVFDKPPVYLGFKQNGVPFGVGISPPANGNWNPALKFSNWVRGAGEVDEQGCNSVTSAVELLSKPGGLELLKKMDRVVGMVVQVMGPLRHGTEKLPTMPSMLVQRLAQEELAQRAHISANRAALVGGLDLSSVDLDLYTDFSTDYSFHDTDLLQLDPTMPKEKEHGHIQLNIAKEKFMVKADGQVTLQPADMGGVPPGPLEMLPEGPWLGHGEMRFDGPAGFVSLRGNIHNGGFASEFCLKFNAPPGSVPPVAAVAPDLATKEQMVAQQVQQLPHQDMEVGTESITVFDKPPVYLGFKQNGVPFGVGISPPANGNWNPALKFSNWVRGAGEIDEQSCNTVTSAVELLSKPGGLELLKKMDRVVGALQAIAPLTRGTHELPTMPSMLVRRLAQDELAQRAHFTASLTPIVGGLASAVALVSVAVAALRLARTGPIREPLISDDA